MQWLMSDDEYQNILQTAKVLEKDRHGVKVLLMPDERIVKLFRIKRLLSLSLLYPYSIRFVRNSNWLKRHGILTVDVERIFFCPSVKRHGVVYPLLPGVTLLSYLQEHGQDIEVASKLMAFVAHLHKQGVYFRSLHLGNVLLLSNGELGLIDVADMRMKGYALSINQRVRNFRHLLRVPRHRELLDAFDLKQLIAMYLEHADLAESASSKLVSSLVTNLRKAPYQ